MVNGIAKTFKKGKDIVFVDIQSHNSNLKRIIEGFSDDFVGKRKLLEKAALKHDLWKHATMNPEVIIKEEGSLFYGHGSEFPSYLVSKDFDEIEFDAEKRTRNFENYYVLNLIRLHHSGFSTFNLFKNTEFVYEYGKAVESNMMDFIKDWYALKTADWIDSSIMSSQFEAPEIPSVIELGMKSEVDLGRTGKDEYYVIPEDFMKKDVKMVYPFLETNLERVKTVIQEHSSRVEQIIALNDFFLGSDRDTIEVVLHGR